MDDEKVNVIKRIGEPKNKAKLLKLIGSYSACKNLFRTWQKRTARLRKPAKQDVDWL